MQNYQMRTAGSANPGTLGATKQNARCKMQNAKCKIQNAKLLNDNCRFSQSGHAWSYQACSTPPRHSAQCSGFGSSSNFQQGVICKGSRCSPVGGSFPSSSSGQFVSGSGSYGSSGSFGSSGSYQTGSIANCRHGQNCNVGSSSIYGSSSGGFGSSSSGSIANCRFGQNCNVGYNTGSSTFGGSGQYNPYGSNGQQVR